LALAYHQELAAKPWARFLKAALHDDTINPNTLLKDFFEDK
jgi:hypothetical protein